VYVAYAPKNGHARVEGRRFGRQAKEGNRGYYLRTVAYGSAYKLAQRSAERNTPPRDEWWETRQRVVVTRRAARRQAARSAARYRRPPAAGMSPPPVIAGNAALSAHARRRYRPQSPCFQNQLHRAWQHGRSSARCAAATAICAAVEGSATEGKPVSTSACLCRAQYRQQYVKRLCGKESRRAGSAVVRRFTPYGSTAVPSIETK